MSQKKPITIAKGVCINPADDSKEFSEVQIFSPSKTEVVRINGAEAERILMEYNIWGGQRNLAPGVVKEYVRRMKGRLWFLTSVSFVLVVDKSGNPVIKDGKQECILVNGQHTLRSIAQQMGTMLVRFDYYETTRDQIPVLFSQFDNGKNRSNLDAIGIIATKFGTMKNSRGKVEPLIPPKALHLISRGIYWAQQCGFRIKCPRLQNDTAQELLLKNKDFVDWLITINPKSDLPFRKVNGMSYNHIWRAPVIGCMFYTWKYCDRSIADRFWNRVLMGETPASGTPPFILERFLQNIKSRKRDHIVDRFESNKIGMVVAKCWAVYLQNPEAVMEDFDAGEFDKMDKQELEEIVFYGSEKTNVEDAVGTQVEKEPGVETKKGHTDHRQQAGGNKRTGKKTSKKTSEKKDRGASAAPPPPSL